MSPKEREREGEGEGERECVCVCMYGLGGVTICKGPKAKKSYMKRKDCKEVLYDWRVGTRSDNMPQR